jgi:serine/threonine-protein kinase
MKKLVSLVLVVSFVFLGALQCQAQEQKVYESPYFGFSISYPADWRTTELGGIIVFLSPLESADDNFSENVNVVVEDLSSAPGITLKEYADISASNLEAMLAGLKIVDRSSTVIDGKEAAVITYTRPERDLKLKQRVYIIISNNKGYNLTYSAKEDSFDKFLPQAEVIIKSFKVNQ